MKLKTLDTQAAMTLSDECFDVAFHEALVHQAVVTYAQRGRRGSARSSLSRTDDCRKDARRQFRQCDLPCVGEVR